MYILMHIKGFDFYILIHYQFNPLKEIKNGSQIDLSLFDYSVCHLM